MNKDLKTIYSELSAGKLTKAAAMERIRALKGAVEQQPTKDKVTRLVAPRWQDQQAAPAGANFAHIEVIEAKNLAFNGNDVAEQYQSAALDLFTRVKALPAQKQAGKTLIQLVIEPQQVILQGLQGLLRSGRLENPNLSVQTILLDKSLTQSALDEVLKAEADNGQSGLIRYIDGQRQVMGWADVAANSSQSSVTFKEHGSYLISGGLGGIGIQFAKAILNETHHAKVILTGRSKDLSKDKQALLDSIQSDNRVSYRQMDLADFASVKSVVSSIEGLSGILHSAGMNQDSYLLQKTDDEFKAVLSPKVSGTIHLAKATEGLNLDFIALFSSVSSWLGNVGQADYACANGFMEAFAEQAPSHMVSINWPLWLDGGMNIEKHSLEALEARTGLSAITSDTGIGAFHHSLLTGERRTMLLEGKADVLTTITDIPKAAQAAKAAVKATVKSAVKVSGDVSEKTRALLREQFSALLKMPAERIDVNAQMENYGIDSILAMNLTGTLEKTFGALPKTLFFEYLTVAELADYLVNNHGETLAKLFSQDDSVRDEPVQEKANTPAKAARTIARSGRRQTLPQAQSTDAIAIVGLSGRYPQSKDIVAYWGNLADGQDCITEVPESRWDWQSWYSEDRTEPGKHYSKWGGFIEGVDEFDPRFFSIAPKEATTIDPQERLFLQHVWLAVEDAGLTRQSLQIPRNGDQSGQVGVYAGVMYGEYHRSGSLASVANRASYVLNVHGPSMTVDTMCSSSLTAIHLACQDLKTGRTDVGIAGGVNVSVHPGKYLMLSSGQFISGDGHCQSFGVGGDGYIPGEGVGVMVLRRLSDAQKDGNHIYGVIKGSALNHGGKTNGYTVPNPQAQASAIGAALNEAKINPRHISYIEAHGTGTKLGDPIEIAALTKAFYQNVDKAKQATAYCLIGSAKSNVGHCESAAGIAGVTKVLLQMKNQKVVPSLHSKALNPHIDFDSTPFIVNQQLTQWQRPVVDGKTVPLIAGISSFGAGGSNAHVIIEEYAAKAKPAYQGSVAIILSARTAEQLNQKAQDLLAHLQSNEVALDTLAYTLQMGREAMDERAAFTAQSLDDVKAQLANFAQVAKGSVKRLQSVPNAPAVSQDNLSQLVESWLAGSEIDWSKLYRIKPGFVSLPGYPFAQDKYWHMPELPVNEQTLDAKLHPLVHRNVSDKQGLRFESRFGSNDGILRNGQVPDAVLLEMAKVASQQVAGDQGVVSIENVLWGTPATAENIEVAVLDDGRVEIFGGDEVYLQACVNSVDAKPTVVNVAGLQKLTQQQWLFAAIASLTEQYQLLALERVTVFGECTETLYADVKAQSDRLDIHLYNEQGVVLLVAKGLIFSAAQEVVEQTPVQAPAIVEADNKPEEKPAPVAQIISLPAVNIVGNAEMVEVGPLAKPANIQLEKPQAFVADAGDTLNKPKLTLSTVTETTARQVAANIQLVDQGTGLVVIEKTQDVEIDVTVASLLAAFNKAQQLENAKVIQLNGLMLGEGREALNLAIEQGLLKAVIHCQLPVIHVLENGALGADALLAGCSDFIVLSEQAEFGFNGLTASPAELAFFNERFGRVRTTQWLAAKNQTGAQLRDKGWMLNVDASPAKALDALAQNLVEKSRIALTELKPHLNRFLVDLVDGLSAFDETANESNDQSSASLKTLFKDLDTVLAQLSDGAESLQISADKTIKIAPANTQTADKTAIALKTDVVKAELNHNGVVEISLQERQAKNMFTEQLALGLREAFDTVAAHPDCKVVVLTGYDSYFASGGTLDTLLAIQDGTAQFTDEKTFQLPMDCPLPVIAAMQGHGLGGGWSFGMFADGYLFSEESHFVSPYMNYGFTPGAGSTLVFPKRLGYDLAKLSLLTGIQLTGSELRAKGLDLPVLPRKAVVETAHEMANRLSVLPRDVLVELKTAWTESFKTELESTYAKELSMHDKTFVGSLDTLKQINSKFIKEQGGEAAPTVSDEGRRELVRAQPNSNETISANKFAPTDVQTQSNSIEIAPAIRAMLAAELHLGEDEIEDDEQFVDLGLDSITGVTFIRKVNAEYGTDIETTKVYSYPTLRELADYVQTLLPSTNEIQSVNETISANKFAPTDVQTQSKSIEIAPTIRSMLAAELHLGEDEIEDDEQFVDLGLDSITGVTFIRKVNAEYGTDIEATKVYSYPTLRELVDYVQTLLPSANKFAPTEAQLNSNEFASTAHNEGRRELVRAERQALTSWRTETKQQIKPAKSNTFEPIAVIGMAGQFPMANDVDTFWQNIAEGKNCISEIDAERWSPAVHFQQGSPTAGKANSKWLGALEQYDLFDPLFFNISPGEADTMDPQQRLFLQACYHGIEHAGINPQSLSGSRCGVFVGCSTGDYHQVNRSAQLSAQGFTGSASSILSARISYFLNLQGPSIAIETACSSSLVAIANACDSLNNGGSDIALAGGSCVMSGPDMHIMTSQAGMLSTDGRCFTFDQRANGFVPGEAVGVVLLKRLSDAEQSQDIIHSVIRGWGINQDGKTNGITAPNEVSQTRLMQQVYDQFDIDPAGIQLIEAHGTGTKLGDPIEVAGLKAAFKPYTEKQDYCALGSAKSNIGHCLTAAGVSGVIKLVQALKHKQLPPTINFEQQNEHINIQNSPFFINTRLQAWDVDAGSLRQGAVSSFGFSGTNAHLVLSEYVAPNKVASKVDVKTDNGSVLIPLSAKTEAQLDVQVQQLLAFVESNPSVDLLELSYTLQVGREAMDARLGLLSSSIEQLKEQLIAVTQGQSKGAVFRNLVKDNKEGMKLIAQDDDMRQTLISQYLQQGKLSKLLKLWTQGLAMDWQLLYGEQKPQRIVLPVYPFAKERYWLAAEQSETVDEQIHPLVQRNVSVLSQQRYQSTFNVSDRYLNQGVLPVSAIVEMVSAAALDATKDVAQDNSVTLHNVELEAPMVVESELEVTLDLNALADGSVGFTLFDNDVTYAQGIVELSAQAPTQWDIASMKDELVSLGKASDISRLWPIGALEQAIGEGVSVDAIESISINGVGNGALYGHIRQDETTDIDLIDASGLGVARITGMQMTQLVDDEAAFTMMAPKWEVIEQFNQQAYRPGNNILVIGGEAEQRDAIAQSYQSSNIETVNFSAEDTVETIKSKLENSKFDHVFFIASSHEVSTYQEDTLISDQQVGIMLLFRLVKAMLALGLDKQAIDWTLVTFNSVQVRVDDVVNPTHAALQGFSGSMAKEFRQWQVRLLDVQSLNSHNLEQADLLGNSPEGVCYANRQGQWFEQQLIEIKQLEQGNPHYRENGVYVLIGGSGGIGEVWSEKLIREHNANIVWIGRRAQDDVIETKLARLAELAPKSMQAPMYVQADVSNAEQMQKAYQTIKARHKDIHGIIHTAVGAFDDSLKSVSEADFAGILAVKIAGAVHLGQVFAQEPLDFVLGFSSNAAFARQGGMSGYSAGCTFKDTYLQQLGRALGCVGKVMNWGYWSIGAGDTVSDSFKARFFESGHRPIEVSEGMGALDKLLASAVGQMSVAKMKPSVKGEMLSLSRWLGQYQPTMKAYPDFSQIEQQPLPVNFDSLDGKVGAEMEGLLPGLLNAILTETKDTLPFYQRWRLESHAIAERAGLTPDANEQSAAQMWAKWDEAKVQWMQDESKKALCQLVETCLRALPDILTGKVKATDVVFPNSSLALVEAVYKTDTVSLAFNECLSDTVVAAVKARLAAEPDAKIRILEIGAGTGSSTVGILRKLKPIQDSIAEYCYTDLSKAFLFHAEKVYAPDAPYLVTKIFNVEEPIEGQGIDANQYDFVVAANVLHATKNIRNTMRNAKAVMKVGGAILLNEISDKSIYGHLTFGLLEGWWLNEDDELRIPGSPGLYPELWQAILNEEGFDPVYYPAKAVHHLGQQIVMAISDGFVNQKQTVAQAVKTVSKPVVKSSKPKALPQPQIQVQPQPIVATIKSAPVDLKAKAIDLVKQVIGSVLKMSNNQLDANEPLETYGIDSIIIGQVNEKLKNDFSDIDATVLYEHQTIAALAGYLVDSYTPRLTEMFGETVTVAAEQPQPVAAVESAPVMPQVTSNLPEKTLDYLKQVIGGALKMNQNQIDAQEPLESYGIDSIIIGQVNEQLKAKFTDIDATVLYECQTVAAMADYLQDKYEPVLVEMFGVQAAPVQPAVQPVVTTPAPKAAPMIRGRGMVAQTTMQQGANQQEPIAIIGVSGIYPQSANLDEYWENLKNGKDCVTEVPANRWDVDAYYDPDEQKAIDQGKSYSKWGGFVSQFAEFDAFFFGISPREAMDMDPQERLFLQEAWHALEDAGITRQTLKDQYQGEVGVFAGITRPGYNLYGSSEAIRKERFRPRSSFSSVANRLSYLLDIHGPSLPIDTMCSSSLTAIHQACAHIERGDCDLAIAGGVNLYVHPLSYVDMASQHMFSKDGKCKSFGEGGNGFVPGEGVGVVILKPQAQAEQDKDHIHGLILASHINHGGKTNGYSVPNPKAQGDLIRKTIDKAGISARAISYIEAHGTGTELGDPIEISGLQQAFGPDSEDKGYCRIGSAKSNIGHCEGAAGIASFTKVLLQLQNKQVVPSLHADVLNPHIQFQKTAFVVNRELNEWQRPQVDGIEQPRIAGISSFGAGGGNAHVLLQEYDMPAVQPAALNEPVAIVLSAKTKDQLQQKVSDLVDFISTRGDDINLTQMAYTLQLGREAMDERLAVLADSVGTLAEKLSAHLYGEEPIADLYVGRVQRNDAQLTLMREDDDLRQAIDNWLVRRKLSKLLDLWVKGLNVDWSLTYGQSRPGMMRLPTYPFAKDIYWIDSLDLDNKAGSDTPKGAEMAAIEDIFNQVEEDTLNTEDAVKMLKSL